MLCYVVSERMFDRCVSLICRGLDEPSKVALSDYVHHLCAGAGSGEYVLNALFVPFGYARRPLLPRLQALTTPTWFLYGAHDWYRPPFITSQHCHRLTVCNRRA